MKIPERLAFWSGFAIVVVPVVVFTVKTHREEKVKREQISIDESLDIRAMDRALAIVKHRMLYDDEYFHKGFAYSMRDLNNEIELQKIAIREE